MAATTTPYRRPFLAALLVAMAAAPIASAAGASLERDIERAIRGYASLTVFDEVRAAIDQEGMVVLSGRVTSLEKRRGLAERVEWVDGVVGVRNDLAVLPSSLADVQLRYRVARAIYGSHSLAHYAARRHPPIRIIVEGGQVTLVGEVATADERRLAEDLAAFFAPGRVTSRLQLAGRAAAVPLD